MARDPAQRTLEFMVFHGMKGLHLLHSRLHLLHSPFKDRKTASFQALCALQWQRFIRHWPIVIIGEIEWAQSTTITPIYKQYHSNAIDKEWQPIVAVRATIVVNDKGIKVDYGAINERLVRHNA
jgi:hypothetical protein